MDGSDVFQQDGAMEDSFAFGFMAIFALFGIVYFALWLWSLIHCIQNRYLSDNNRLIGIILIVVLGIVGSIVYLFLPREPQAQR
jgi:hypothetical protein